MQVDQGYLDFFLIRVCRAHHRLARQSLHAIGLHRGQPPLMFALGVQEGLTHSDLAEKMEVTPAAVSNMVKRLEHAGFVLRRRDAEDERVSRVYLTDAGRAIHSEMAAIARHVSDATFAGFTEEERTLLREFLNRIQDNLQRAVTPGQPHSGPGMPGEGSGSGHRARRQDDRSFGRRQLRGSSGRDSGLR